MATGGDGRLQAAKPRSVRAMRKLRTIRRPVRKVESPHFQNACQQPETPRGARRESITRQPSFDRAVNLRRALHPIGSPLTAYRRLPRAAAKPYRWRLVKPSRACAWRTHMRLNPVGASLRCSEALRTFDSLSCAKRAIMLRGRQLREHAGHRRHARNLRE